MRQRSTYSCELPKNLLHVPSKENRKFSSKQVLPTKGLIRVILIIGKITFSDILDAATNYPNINGKMEM